MKAKPFVKWVGGKGQLLSQLAEYLPSQLDGRPFVYIEPFVGGGAMLFYMLKAHPEIKRIVINDINSHLVTTYRIIKDSPDELIERLSALEKLYFGLEDESARKSFYLAVRKLFNDGCIDDVDRAKYLLFLNRTCFNGLYRENSKGKFNVPFGRYLNPTICDPETILADSKLLNSTNVTILNEDYTKIQDYIDNNCVNFVYFDPPYRPLSTTSSFNSYVKGSFNDEEQLRLGDFSKMLACQNNVYWMLSNSDCSAKNPEDKFFEKIYSKFYINRVLASRSINSNPAKRGKLSELLICNYEPAGYGKFVAENNQPYMVNASK